MVHGLYYIMRGYLQYNKYNADLKSTDFKKTVTQIHCVWQIIRKLIDMILAGECIKANFKPLSEVCNILFLYVIMV